MKFGEILREAFEKNLTKEIFESLKSILLELANKQEKGCKVIFSSISAEVIKEIILLIENEAIQMMAPSFFSGEEDEKDTWYIIWEPSAIRQKNTLTSSPCEECSEEVQLTCNYKCPAYREWERSKPNHPEYLHDEFESILVSVNKGSVCIDKKSELLKLGDTLQKASSNELKDEEIFEYLKPILLSIANKWKKGCKLCFSGISEDTIQKILDRIKAEDIQVMDSSLFIGEEAGAWYIIGDSSAVWQKTDIDSSPCENCPAEIRMACCGCPKYREWKEKKPTHSTMYYHEEVESVDVAILGNAIYINRKLCYSKEGIV